jgi:RNA polymerase sigma-70 factor (ECF subfamily)
METQSIVEPCVGDAPSPSAATLPAFRVVYDEYVGFVCACVRRLGVPPDALDDVVQEIFVVVHARLNSVERPLSLRSWIYGVVWRVVKGYRRGRRKREAREIPVALESLVMEEMKPSPLDLALLGDDLRLLSHSLEEVAPQKREVLIMAGLDEMTVPEIARAVGVNLNTAYSRLRSGRQEFIKAFARQVRPARGH